LHINTVYYYSQGLYQIRNYILERSTGGFLNLIGFHVPFTPHCEKNFFDNYLRPGKFRTYSSKCLVLIIKINQRRSAFFAKVNEKLKKGIRFAQKVKTCHQLQLILRIFLKFVHI